MRCDLNKAEVWSGGVQRYQALHRSIFKHVHKCMYDHGASLYLAVQTQEDSDCGRRRGHDCRITMRKEDTGNTLQ